jgi:hypothetical protein
VFLTAREEEELKNRRRRKRKKCKNLSPSFFGFFFSLNKRIIPATIFITLVTIT